MKDLLYYFCSCFYPKQAEQQEDNYITYNDIYKRNNYSTSILDYTTSN